MLEPMPNIDDGRRFDFLINGIVIEMAALKKLLLFRVRIYRGDCSEVCRAVNNIY